MKENKKINSKLKMFSIIVVFVLFFINSNIVFGELKLDNINFDPAIISAGDEVDLVIEYHDEITPFDDNKVSDSEYSFKVEIQPDDSLSEKYTIVTDAKGDDVLGTIYGGQKYNKVFRVKVNYDAPAGKYQYKLVGQWYKDNEPMGSTRIEKFFMNVKKEGIIIEASNLNTLPAEIRPGDNFVQLVTQVENIGQKDAKFVEINLDLPELIESSYSNNNKISIGRLNAGESKEVIFHLDLDEELKGGVYNIRYNFNYMDLDDNKFTKVTNEDLLVKKAPNLKVINVNSDSYAGDSSQIYVTIKNIGEETAESVDVRFLKESSQPFNADVRSEYIGELEPNEEGLVVFNIDIDSNAEIKSHDLKLLIRAKGDSDEGDDNIYTFNERAKINVIGKKPNMLKYFGIGGAIVLIIVFSLSKLINKGKKK